MLTHFKLNCNIVTERERNLSVSILNCFEYCELSEFEHTLSVCLSIVETMVIDISRRLITHFQRPPSFGRLPVVSCLIACLFSTFVVVVVCRFTKSVDFSMPFFFSSSPLFFLVICRTSISTLHNRRRLFFFYFLKILIDDWFFVVVVVAVAVVLFLVPSAAVSVPCAVKSTIHTRGTWIFMYYVIVVGGSGVTKPNGQSNRNVSLCVYAIRIHIHI